MSIEKAQKIFQEWKNYIEIHTKLSTIFEKIPESFLPYPVKILEEALNIIAEDYFNKGNYRMSDNIKELLSDLYIYTKDEEAIKTIINSFSQENLEIINLHFALLKEVRDSWLKSKYKNNYL